MTCPNCGEEFEFRKPEEGDEKIYLNTGKNSLVRPNGDVLAECPSPECGIVFDPADQ